MRVRFQMHVIYHMCLKIRVSPILGVGSVICSLSDSSMHGSCHQERAQISQGEAVDH